MERRSRMHFDQVRSSRGNEAGAKRCTEPPASLRRLLRCDPRGSHERLGFTLVEVMMATLLTGLVLTGVLASSLQLTRSAVRITQYAEMSAQVRSGLDQLGRDLRGATAITWNGASDVTLT